MRGSWTTRRRTPFLTRPLVDVGADAEMDIIEPGTPLAEFYRLSMAAIGPPAVEAGVLTAEEAEGLVDRPLEPDFLGCGFVHIGVWGRRPPITSADGESRARGSATPAPG